MRSSFGEGFEAYAVGDMTRLTRLASMLTGDRERARDLVQETLVQVGCAWSRIDRAGNPGGYATTTMSRLAWRQSARGRTELTLLGRYAPTQTAPDEFKRIDDAAALRDAMHALGARQRAVLRDVEAVSPDVQRRTWRRQLARRGVDAGQARLIYRVLTGRHTKTLSNNDQVTIAELVNAGILDRTSSGGAALAQDVRYSLLVQP